jgi:hypothetical protein
VALFSHTALLLMYTEPNAFIEVIIGVSSEKGELPMTAYSSDHDATTTFSFGFVARCFEIICRKY